MPNGNFKDNEMFLIKKYILNYINVLYCIFFSNLFIQIFILSVMLWIIFIRFVTSFKFDKHDKESIFFFHGWYINYLKILTRAFNKYPAKVFIVHDTNFFFFSQVR